MITNRSELTDRVFKWLVRDQTTDSFINQDLIDTYIQLCESDINRELRIREMQETINLTQSTSVDFVELPASFRGVSSFEYNNRPFDLEYYSTRREMKEKHSNQVGRPEAYIIVGKKAIFNCIPDGEHELTLDYYRGIDALSENNPTNDILQKHPDLYLYGTVSQALMNLNNQARMQSIMSVYSAILGRIKMDDQSSKLPVGTSMKTKNAIG